MHNTWEDDPYVEPSNAMNTRLGEKMSFDNVKWTWMNGRYVAWNDSNVHLSVHALHYGTGVFEGIRSYRTRDGLAVFRMEEHIDRLYRSAAFYDMTIPYTKQQLMDAVCGVIQRNGFVESYIRPLVFMGSETLGMRAQCPTEVVIMAWPNILHVSAESKARGAKLTLSPYRKIDNSMLPVSAKACGQYLNARLATMDAIKRGYDEALLLNAQGNVAEAAVANIFVVRKGVLTTNNQDSSILMGITRDAIMQIAESLGHKVNVGTISVDDLHEADEIFLTGTACEVLAITDLDGHTVSSGKPGAITTQIADIYDRTKTGEVAAWEHWLHRLPIIQTTGDVAANH